MRLGCRLRLVLLQCAELVVRWLVLLGLDENCCKMSAMVLYLRSSILSQHHHELVLQLLFSPECRHSLHCKYKLASMMKCKVHVIVHSSCQCAEFFHTVEQSESMHYSFADSKVAVVTSIIPRPFAFPHWNLDVQSTTVIRSASTKESLIVVTHGLQLQVMYIDLMSV